MRMRSGIRTDGIRIVLGIEAALRQKRFTGSEQFTVELLQRIAAERRRVDAHAPALVARRARHEERMTSGVQIREPFGDVSRPGDGTECCGGFGAAVRSVEIVCLVETMSLLAHAGCLEMDPGERSRARGDERSRDRARPE